MCLAVPGQITEIINDTQGDPLNRRAKVNFGGILKEISLAYVPEAQVGDYTVVHVGFALSLVEEEEAKKVFDYFKKMGELDELNEGVEDREIS